MEGTTRTRVVRCLVALLALLTVGTTLSTGSPAAAEPGRPGRGEAPTVTITQQRTHDAVRREIVGGSLRWIGSADSAWDARKRKVRGDVAALMRRIGLGTVRYPGGTVANLWDFRRALGRPGCQTSGGLLRPLFASLSKGANGYTIPKYASFSRMARTRTNLMIPMINQSPEDAVAFVRAVAKATGQRSFIAEIGNEPNIAAQRYWRSQNRGKRMLQYITGDRVRPDGPGDNRLYAANGCNLQDAAVADGSRGQSYRPRYVPVASGTTPRLWVGGQEWTYVEDIDDAGLFDRAFSLNADRTRVVFANRLLGPKPRGEMRFEYTTEQAGFTDFYRALRAIPDIDVQVCSGWVSPTFMRRMDSLGHGYDCLAPHLYAYGNGHNGDRSVYESLVRASLLQVRRLGELRRRMHASSHPAADRRFLIVTEYGGKHRRREGPDHATFVRELVQAVLLVGQVQEGVRLSNITNFRVLVEQFGKQATLSSRAYLLAFARHLVGQRPVRVTGTPKGVVLVATRSAGRTSVLAVNTNWAVDRRVRLGLAGRGRGPTCVDVRTLRADPRSSTRPRSVKTRPRTVLPPRTRTWSSGSFTHTFPSHSIQLLTFRDRSGARCPGAGPL